MLNFLLTKFYGDTVLPQIKTPAADGVKSKNMITNKDFTYFAYDPYDTNKTVLLLPGNNFSCFSHENFLMDLAEGLNAKLYCLEYRTASNPSPTIEELISYCERFTNSVVDSIGSNTRFYAVGHSLGCSLLLHVSQIIKIENAILLSPFVNAPSFCCNFVCDPEPCIYTCSNPSLLNNYYLATTSKISNVYIVVAGDDKKIDRYQSIQLLSRFYNARNLQYLKTLIYTHDNILDILKILSVLRD